MMNITGVDYRGSLTKSFAIKSLASAEMLSNSSALKSHLAMVTLDNVSISDSPINGDKPDNLWIYVELWINYACTCDKSCTGC